MVAVAGVPAVTVTVDTAEPGSGGGSPKPPPPQSIIEAPTRNTTRTAAYLEEVQTESVRKSFEI